MTLATLVVHGTLKTSSVYDEIGGFAVRMSGMKMIMFTPTKIQLMWASMYQYLVTMTFIIGKKEKKVEC